MHLNFIDIFSVTDAKFGILTNGIIFRFFTDIVEPNKMDKKPFFEIDLRNVTESDEKELKQFTKSAFNLESIIESASELKYKGEMKKIMVEQLKDPSDEFVRFFAKKVYSRPLTQNAITMFAQITKSALNQFIKERVDERLKTALGASDNNKPEEVITLKTDKNEIITTEEEWDGFYIIRSILSEIVDPNRVTIRDRKSYCGVLLDNNQKKIVCRMHFNSIQKKIGLFDSQERSLGGGRIEYKIPIENLMELYNFSERLKNTLKPYIANE
jgi:hypothetical protein